MVEWLRPPESNHHRRSRPQTMRTPCIVFQEMGRQMGIHRRMQRNRHSSVQTGVHHRHIQLPARRMLSRGKRLPTTEEALYGTGAIVAQFSSAMAYGPRPKLCFGRDDAPRVILFPWGIVLRISRANLNKCFLF